MTENEMRENILKEFARCDFVKVTHCKDCRWYEKENMTISANPNWCKYHDVGVGEYGYCSFARKK